MTKLPQNITQSGVFCESKTCWSLLVLTKLNWLMWCKHY